MQKNTQKGVSKMKTKNNLWHKTCLIENCEVVGFNKLYDLKPDQYGKKNYCLSVLINRSQANNMLSEIRKEEIKAQKIFGCELRTFKRITNETDGRLCPPDKMVLNLSTDSKNGMHQIGIFDEDNKAFAEPFKTIQEGALISIHFDLSMYKTNSVGVSLRLNSIKVNKSDLEIRNRVNNVSPFSNQMKSLKNNNDFFDEYEDDEEEI